MRASIGLLAPNERHSIFQYEWHFLLLTGSVLAKSFSTEQGEVIDLLHIAQSSGVTIKHIFSSKTQNQKLKAECVSIFGPIN